MVGNQKGNRYRLGDILVVEIVHVDVDRRELDFRFVRRLPRPTGRPRKTAPARPQRKKTKKSVKKRAVKRQTATRKTVKKKAVQRKKKTATSPSTAKRPAAKKKTPRTRRKK